MFLERALEISRLKSTTCPSENSRSRLSALASSLGKRHFGSSIPWDFLTKPRHLIAQSALVALRRRWTSDRLELSRRAIRLAAVPQVHSTDSSDEPGRVPA